MVLSQTFNMHGLHPVNHNCWMLSMYGTSQWKTGSQSGDLLFLDIQSKAIDRVPHVYLLDKYFWMASCNFRCSPRNYSWSTNFPISYSPNGQKLSVVEKHKHLGIVISTKLS